ncbi:MAG: cytochrome c biogenesis protein ResB [Deltaproteobacteria bacterium]|nr:cytochrome c biogenesis protein ResB [Deltaproteobacteria bacterium]
MADDKHTQTLADRVWNFFTSLKLAISVVIILAVVSIFGTIIEQNQPLEKYQKFYSDGTIRFLDMLNMFNMYHSWWFVALLCLFTINLSCCTLDRLPRVIRTVRNRKTTLDEGLEKSLPQVDRWKKKGTVAQYLPLYTEALGKAFAPALVTANSETHHLYAERGVVSRFGVYVTHLSIIIIFIGAIIGSVAGFKGYVNIVEGQAVNEVPRRGGGPPVPLGFTVRCNKFWVDYYPGGQPKEYASDLSIIDNGREVLRKKIVVNDPLRYKGIWFYQSSYGQAGGTTARIAVTPASGGPSRVIALSPNEKAEIPGYGTIGAVDYQGNFQGFGPALLVSVEKPGKPPADFWLLKSFPDFDRQRNDALVFSFLGINEQFYTGLQVAEDPGVNVVWAGCALMVIGIMIAFFMSHQRVWLRVAPAGDGRVEVVLAGSTSRNRLAFERKFERIQAEIKAAAK